MFEFLFFDDEKIFKLFTFIKNHNNVSFVVFINDYATFVIDFDIFFEFLHIKYFSRCVFELVHLLKLKTYLFLNILKF